MLLVMLLTTTTAWAQETTTPWDQLQAQLDAASTNAGSPTEITLTGNVVAPADKVYLTIPQGKYVTLDLNGYGIDRGLESATVDGYVLRVEGSLTVTDGSGGNKGKIKGGYNTASAGAFIRARVGVATPSPVGP